MQLPPEELEKAEKLGFRLITSRNSEYPERLTRIHKPPEYLYIKGQILPQDELSLTVVGTRRFTTYGREVTGFLVEQLASAGLTIISGMCRGIDSFAHQAALRIGGRTIAVLGSGLDVVYPPENKRLYEEISQNGAVISEFPLGMQPTHYTFPIRDRIMAGISMGTLVIEAGKKSGALITAKFALDEGREVFAVPGTVFSPASEGTLELLQLGAKLVRQASDVLEELNIEAQSQKIQARKIIPESKEEKILLEVLANGPKHIDELVRETELSAATVNATLSLMEIKGLVRHMGKMQYRGK